MLSLPKVAYTIAALLSVTLVAQSADQEAGTSAREEARSVPSWPRDIQVGDKEVTVYQPQLESFKSDQLKALSAISVALVELP